ncbi:MAG: XTP/dITP diphosphohydrolase [Candidatus Omnitrophota bacterium]|jgi:XTP/dITP diphosphohydrolase
MSFRTLVVGTANKDKCREIKKLLSGLKVNIVSIDELGPVPKVVENGKNFVENACKKAEAYSKLSDWLTLGDDSGLCVDVLNGRPGIMSARFAGPDCTYHDNSRKLLRLMFRKPEEDRKAHFNCTIALYRNGKKIKIIEGICDGMIAEEALGDRGFGFDPIFIPEGEHVTFGQMSSVKKNAISHRGEALEQVREFLEEYYEKNKE